MEFVYIFPVRTYLCNCRPGDWIMVTINLEKLLSVILHIVMSTCMYHWYSQLVQQVIEFLKHLLIRLDIEILDTVGLNLVIISLEYQNWTLTPARMLKTSRYYCEGKGNRKPTGRKVSVVIPWHQKSCSGIFRSFLECEDAILRLV